MTEERLRELEELCENATEGPWAIDKFGLWTVPKGTEIIIPGPFNGLFICTARDAMPALLAEIRRLQAEVARLRQVFEKAGKFVEAVNADSFEDGALYKALNDAVSQWTPSKAKEES